MGHWKVIDEDQIKGHFRGAIKHTQQWQEVMDLCKNGGIPQGKGIRLSKMPNVPGKNIATNFVVNLNKEFKRQGLQFVASAYGKYEVNIRRI